MILAEQILLIEPVGFRRNEETLSDNAFQTDEVNPNRQADVIREFVAFRNLLRENGIDVTVLIPPDASTPDAVFPNNWFSTDPSGRLIFYPMKAANRRKERRDDFIQRLMKKYPNVTDLTYLENSGVYLVGTGSLVIDHDRKIALACISGRTTEKALRAWREKTKYETLTFKAFDKHNQPIYHTNVLLSLGEGFAILCSESIPDLFERMQLIDFLKDTGREIIDINFAQLVRFCGNCLQLKNSTGEKFFVMSNTAYHGFTPLQRGKIMQHTRILTAELATIERVGGGSARCMVAELF